MKLTFTEKRALKRAKARKHYHEVFKKNPKWKEIARANNLRLQERYRAAREAVNNLTGQRDTERLS